MVSSAGEQRPGRLGLFPPDRSGRPAPWLAGAAHVAAVVVAAAVAYARLSAADAGSVWAEDGARFLREQLSLGFPTALTTPYAGYMHLVPRTVAAVVAAAPLTLAAHVFVASACLVVGLCAVATFHLSRPYLPSAAVRLGLAAMVPLLPVAGFEPAGNVANSHWFLMAAAFWACLSRPAGRAGIALATAVVVLAMASDPLTLAYVPVVVARVVLVRGWRQHVVTAAFVLSAAVQLAVVLGTQRTARAPVALDTVAFAYAPRVCLVLLAGPSGAHAAFAAAGWAAAVLALAVFVGLALAVVLTRPRLRWLVVAGFGASVAFWVVPARLTWIPRMDVDGRWGLDAASNSRYLVVPMLLLLVVAAAAVQAVVERRPGLPALAAVLVPLVLLGPSVVIGFRAEPDSRQGDAWSTGLAAATRQCRGDAGLAAASVPLAPDGRRWGVAIPCGRLR